MTEEGEARERSARMNDMIRLGSRRFVVPQDEAREQREVEDLSDLEYTDDATEEQEEWRGEDA